MLENVFHFHPLSIEDCIRSNSSPKVDEYTPKEDDFFTSYLFMYQIDRFHGFLWSGGGAVSDFLIHNIDECSWMKDAFPVKAQASGGRHYRGNCVDQNFDEYSIEYTFADGAKLYLEGRCIDGCFGDHSSFAHE